MTDFFLTYFLSLPELSLPSLYDGDLDYVELDPLSSNHIFYSWRSNISHHMWGSQMINSKSPFPDSFPSLPSSFYGSGSPSFQYSRGRLVVGCCPSATR